MREGEPNQPGTQVPVAVLPESVSGHVAELSVVAAHVSCTQGVVTVLLQVPSAWHTRWGEPAQPATHVPDAVTSESVVDHVDWLKVLAGQVSWVHALLMGPHVPSMLHERVGLPVQPRMHEPSADVNELLTDHAAPVSLASAGQVMRTQLVISLPQKPSEPQLRVGVPFQPAGQTPTAAVVGACVRLNAAWPLAKSLVSAQQPSSTHGFVSVLHVPSAWQVRLGLPP